MRILLCILLFLCTSFAFAQTGTIYGKVFDTDTKETLIGVTVLVERTGLGEITNLEGIFIIKNVPAGNYTVRIKYIGYEDEIREVALAEGQNFSIGDVFLVNSAIGLQEVEVFANIVDDRKTPLAISNISSIEIDQQLGSMALPEIMNSTPGVYATQGDGSYGDGYINIRGFGQEEVLFMINGVPMNDMETGTMYWSNFAGLSEVTRSMQIQRGLGASKLAVNSVGGTVNIVTNPAERKKGGSAEVTLANGTFSNRYRLTLNSGLLKSGWAVTFQGSRTTGDGMRPGTYVDAWAYFLSASKKMTENHTLLFTVFGAPALRGRAYNTNTATYEKYDDYQHNSAMGYYNGRTSGAADGQLLSVSENNAHKPQMTLMSLWNINEKLTLTTSAYASIARVYGTARSGSAEILTQEGYQDFEAYRTANLANVQTIQNPYGAYGTSVTGAQSTRMIEARYNNHNWYGVISNLSYQLNSTTSIVGGIDVRDYKATHYAEVHHLLGGDFWLDQFSGNDNNLLTPNRIARKGDKVRYDYDGVVRWGSAFAQIEKTIGQLDIFASGNYSRQQMWREGNMWSGDPKYIENSLGSSDKRVFNNYNVKAGANFRITGRHNVFINGGTFSRAPYLRNVFVDSRYGNKYLEGLKNESVQSAEAGYSYRTGRLRLNLNVYYTQWKDRILANEAFIDPQSLERQALSGLAAVHKGIEIDGRYEPVQGLEITGAFTKGDWRWTSDGRTIYDGGDVDEVYIKGLKVGNTAQTTAFIGLHSKLIKDTYFGVRFNYFADLYESFEPAERIQPGFKQVRKLPAYHILDIYGGYFFEIATMRSRAGVNIHNVLNDNFIRRSDEAFGVQEMYGFPINFNLSFTVYFD